MAVDPPDTPTAPGGLPCGHNTDLLADHVATGELDTHEQNCPHCQRTATGLAALHHATTLLKAEPLPPPPGLLPTIMATIRAGLTSTRHLTLSAEPGATLTITEHAAAAILAAVTDTIPGVTCRGCHFPTTGDPTHLHLRIGLQYGLRAQHTATQIRATIRDTAHTTLGIGLHTVDITIDDIHPPPH